MPKATFSESVLALFAGRERAAAIYGDLAEMSATRGGLWFAAAYGRTLFSLAWRIVLALFVADVGRQFIFDAFHIYLRHTPAAWRANTGSFVDLLNSSGPLLACIMSTLWFALPFAAVRYGVRDRFVRLTFAIAAGTTIAFLAVPWISLAAAVVTFALAGAALGSPRWRKPMEVLAWIGAVGVPSLAAFTVLARQARSILRDGHITAAYITAYGSALAFQASLLLVAIVCSRVHRRLLAPTAPVD